MINHHEIYQMAQSQAERLRQEAARQQRLKELPNATSKLSWLRRWKLTLLRLIYAKAMIVTADEIQRLQPK